MSRPQGKEPENALERHRRQRAIIGVLAILLIAAIAVGISVGRYPIDLGDALGIFVSRVFPIEQTWTSQTENMLLGIRLPRILAAVLVGAALAVSGATYQGIFRNPLVSPDLLGVSSGACVGASVAILLHMSGFMTEVFALVMGLVAVGITCRIPSFFRSRNALTLVLAGVIVSGIMTSIQGLCKYLADPYDELQSIVFWTMGSLASVHMSDLALVIVPMLVAFAILLVVRWRLNIMALGDVEAKSLGVPVRAMKGLAIVCSTVLTACAVCLTGKIDWVGLVVPHIGRMLVGDDNRFLIPATLLTGSVFMILVDTVARCMTSSEIPLSILTGIIGGPLFLVILARRGMKENI
jgi:iron complex transport system permease protein